MNKWPLEFIFATIWAYNHGLTGGASIATAFGYSSTNVSLKRLLIV